MAVSSCMKADCTVGGECGGGLDALRSLGCLWCLRLGTLESSWPFQSTASSDDMTLTSPSMDNSSAELLPSGDSPLNKRMTENLLASLSEHERAAILNVPAAQNPEDLRMFAR